MGKEEEGEKGEKMEVEGWVRGKRERTEGRERVRVKGARRLRPRRLLFGAGR